MAEEVIRAGTVNLARLMTWKPRADAVIAEIDSMNLDLIGFQETTETFEADLAKRLQGNWIVASDYVNCPAFARADRFYRTTYNGHSWIRITMHGSVRNRYGSAVLLKRKSDGLVFVFATIHPSNNGESSATQAAKDRIREAEDCWKALADWGVTKFPILLVGDMNDRAMPPNGLPGVFVAHGMTDVLQFLKQKARIDRAFVKDLRVLSATVNNVAASASDHDFGVFVVAPGAPPPPPPPPPGRLHGVDVSSYQGANWIPAPNDTFVMVKCSEGTTYTSPTRWSQVSAGRTAGIVVGHYHYLWPGNPIEQARFFVDSVGALAGEPLWCDWESTQGGHPSVDDAAQFIAEVQRLMPENKVGLYCNRSDWMGTTVKAGDGLWIAEFGVDKPATATKWIFWQYADKPTDQNWSSFVSVDDLKAWCKKP